MEEGEERSGNKSELKGEWEREIEQKPSAKRRKGREQDRVTNGEEDIGGGEGRTER